jgi:transposase, IS5 family
MKQTTFDSLAYTAKKKQTRREKFLAEMEQVVPWKALLVLIEEHYPKSGKAGRPPMSPEKMLRIHFLQQWYALSDPAMEDALYEIESMRRFAGLELNVDPIPDETTILKFRRFLEKHTLAPKILETVNTHLMERGMQMRAGTLVDATIIHAPSSTKNRTGERDPEMHQTKKGNQWYFGMKAHIGVDSHSGLVRVVVGTAANTADVTQIDKLLTGEEKSVHGDAGYTGAQKYVKGQQELHIAEKRGKIQAMVESAVKEATVTMERLKAQLRARVEHPFQVLKCQFGFTKVRYRGLAKNTAQLHTLFALVNLKMARRRLAAAA